MQKKQLATVEEVRARLEEWRQNRPKGVAIPDELWSAASALARRDGLGRTAAALRLDYGKLKRLMMASAPVGHQRKRPLDKRLVASQKPCPS